MAYADDTYSAWALDGARADRYPLHLPAARNDLNLKITHSGRGLQAEMEFSTDLFDPPTAERLAQDFVAVADRLIRTPDRRLDDRRLP